ncbi:MAG: hypothetical protein Q7U88_02315, partial [Desulfocapsaceae bacterium]|nr:hypothetical protein [Desulfocapsaceae bacterium]
MKMSSYGIVAATVLSAFILFFFQPQAQAATLTVNSIADSGAGTLRQAILDAVADDTIDFNPTAFPPATPATITLISQLTINKNLTINGNGGVILDANQTGRVMLIDDETAAIMSASLSGITFKNGLVSGPGGGIYTKEHLTLANVIFTNNTATNSSGGAIHNETGATLTLTDSSFTANNALHGGAIFNLGPLSVSG